MNSLGERYGLNPRVVVPIAIAVGLVLVLGIPALVVKDGVLAGMGGAAAQLPGSVELQVTVAGDQAKVVATTTADADLPDQLTVLNSEQGSDFTGRAPRVVESIDRIDARTARVSYRVGRRDDGSLIVVVRSPLEEVRARRVSASVTGTVEECQQPDKWNQAPIDLSASLSLKPYDSTARLTS